MPNIVMNAVKRLILAIFFVFRFFFRILTCKYFRRPQRIGELPTYFSKRESAGNEQFAGTYSPTMSPLADSSWSNWSEQSNANSAISEQIEEYRRRRQEELLAEKAAKKRGHPHGGGANAGNGPLNIEEKKNADEPDLFAEMQPKVKAPKKLLMRKNQQFTNQRQNRFQMQDNMDVDEYLGNVAEIEEFGELKEMDDKFCGNEGKERATSWLYEDDNVDLDELDEFEREQRRKEREERKMKRQNEHAQQVEEKRKKKQTEHRIQF